MCMLRKCATKQKPSELCLLLHRRRSHSSTTTTLINNWRKLPLIIHHDSAGAICSTRVKWLNSSSRADHFANEVRYYNFISFFQLWRLLFVKSWYFPGDRCLKSVSLEILWSIIIQVKGIIPTHHGANDDVYHWLDFTVVVATRLWSSLEHHNNRWSCVF